MTGRHQCTCADGDVDFECVIHGDTLDQAAMFKRFNAVRQARFDRMLRDGCCGEIELRDEHGICPGVGMCPKFVFGGGDD